MTHAVFCGTIGTKGGDHMTQDELLFFTGHAGALALYAKLREELTECWPEVEIRVAFVSTRRMGRRCPEVFIIVSFGLHREVSSPRILAASEPYPGRWTHHVIVSDLSEIDGELLGWIAEAHDYALVK